MALIRLSPARLAFLSLASIWIATSIAAGQTSVAQADAPPPERPVGHLESSGRTSTYDLLAARLDRHINEFDWGGGQIGAIVVDLDHNVTAYERNASEMMTPGAATKLLTALVALERLGPAHRFSTELFMRGEIERRTLQGDLVVRGTGDPSITTFAGKNPEAIGKFFRPWVQELKRRRVREIEGSIYVDDTAFDVEPFPPGWPTQHLGDPSMPEVSALNLNDNTVDIYWLPSKEGEIARKRIEPSLGDHIQFSNNVRVDSRRPNAREYWRFRQDAVIGIRGYLPEGTAAFDRVSVPNAPTFFGHVFKDFLEIEEIDVKGGVLLWAHAAPSVKQAADLVPLQTSSSPPLSEMIPALFDPGRNLDAEVLLKTLGAQRSGEAGSFLDGAAAVMEYLRRHDLRTSGAVVVDGSGLSSFNRLSPRNVVQLFRIAALSPHAQMISGAIPEIEFDLLTHDLTNAASTIAEAPRVQGFFSPTAEGYAAAGWVWQDNGQPMHFAFLIARSSLPTEALRRQVELLVREIAATPIQ